MRAGELYIEMNQLAFLCEECGALRSVPTYETTWSTYSNVKRVHIIVCCPACSYEIKIIGRGRLFEYFHALQSLENYLVEYEVDNEVVRQAEMICAVSAKGE